MATITASDYAVEIKIKRDDYMKWYLDQYKQSEDYKRLAGNLPISFVYKNKIITEIERELTRDLVEKGKLENARFKVHDQEITEIKIADIVFTYENQEMIALLKERGKSI